MTRTVFVTGARGKTGREVVAQLAERGDTVVFVEYLLGDDPAINIVGGIVDIDCGVAGVLVQMTIGQVDGAGIPTGP